MATGQGPLFFATSACTPPSSYAPRRHTHTHTFTGGRGKWPARWLQYGPQLSKQAAVAAQARHLPWHHSGLPGPRSHHSAGLQAHGALWGSHRGAAEVCSGASSKLLPPCPTDGLCAVPVGGPAVCLRRARERFLFPALPAGPTFQQWTLHPGSRESSRDSCPSCRQRSSPTRVHTGRSGRGCHGTEKLPLPSSLSTPISSQRI